MYLKEIRMKNFKSFKRIRIPFLPGFTSITGPNGSGKSNIADAILFVLGPRSSKAIRAERLTDLIFNGGNSRKAASHCKVSIVFDNGNREMPIDDDEVILTRRIKKAPLKENPENYYSYFYVNGKSSSLSDFSQLLSEAAINGYNVVQQGDVTNVVEMGNVARRKIIDDVAGVSQLDKDIEKAELEKEKVEENLDHVGIILEEIGRVLARLKSEGRGAMRYKKLKDKLDELKGKIALKKKMEVEIELEEVRKQMDSYRKDKDRLDKEIEELKEELKKKREEMRKLEEIIAEKGGGEIRDKIDEARKEKIKLEEKMNYFVMDLSRIKGERRGVGGELDKIEREMEKLSENKISIEKKLNRRERELDEQEEELRKKKAIIARSSEEAREISEQLTKMKEENEEMRQKLHEFILERDRINRGMDGLLTQISELEEEKEAFETEVKEIGWRLREMKKEEREGIQKKKELEEKIFEKKKRGGEISAELKKLEKEILHLQHSLSSMKIDEGYSKGVRAILDAGNRIKGIHGTISQLAKIEKKYELAIGIAAGNRMQSIVVENDGVAQKAIEYLRKNNYGRATFLPLNKMIFGKPRGKALMAIRNEKARGFAIDLVKFDEKYRNAFWYVFRDTVMVDDLETARKLMVGVRLVSLKGDLITSSGAMIGGSTVPSFKFRSESVVETTKKLRKAREKRDKFSEELIDLRNEILKMEEEMGRISFDDNKKAELEVREREFKGKLRVVSKKLGEKEEELIGQRKELEEMEDKIGGVKEELNQLEESMKEKGKLLVNKSDLELGVVEEKIAKMREEKRNMEMNRETILKKLEIFDGRKKELSAKVENLEERKKECSSSIKKLKKNREEWEEKLEALMKVEEKMSGELDTLAKNRDESYKKIVKMESELEKKSTKVETLFDLISRAKARLPVLEETLKELEMEAGESRKENEDKDAPIDLLKKEAREIEGKMEEMEPVNMKALEELERESERKEKFDGDVQRLKKQREKLMKLVKEIEKKKKDSFYKVFNSINENFKDVYKNLSGGEAELELENPSNPFDGGIIIKASPEGKKSLRLGALSGGEKSMASLAFIFAIQEYRPSPFYVLDEIDMFLDGVNAEVVAKTIKNNSRKAQFIVVSLRKVTLQQSDHTYGVTMQEKGISDIIGNVDISAIEGIENE